VETVIRDLSKICVPISIS